jgi:hypothetical protein
MVETKYVHTLMVRKFFLEGGLLEVKDGTWRIIFKWIYSLNVALLCLYLL